MNLDNLGILENLETCVKELIVNIVGELIEKNCIYYDDKEKELVFNKDTLFIYD